MKSFEASGIILPQEDAVPQPSLSYAYGAAYVMAKYCGFEKPPYPPRGQLQHGWVRRQFTRHPAMAIWDDGKADPKKYHWVCRKDIQDYLRVNGYPNTHAIGAGAVYLPEMTIPRMPNSLLVMPAHSLFYEVKHKWDSEKYLSEILSVRDEFDEVAICVHPACLHNRYWVDSFTNAGFEIIEGATFLGKNALLRMQWLMSRFEYVTTNMMGTCIGYAAYFGAKPSIYGTYVQLNKEELSGGPFDVYPEVKDHWLSVNSEKPLRESYPYIFCHPKQAESRKEWGHLELGGDCRKTPDQLRALWGWPDGKSRIVVEKEIAATQQKQCLPEVDLCKSMTSFFELFDFAEKGSLDAMLMLGHVFRNGLHNGYVNIDEAMRWFEAAANAGSPEAMLEMGDFLLTDKKDQKNLQKAEYWLKSALEAGLQDAQALLEQLRSKMEHDKIEDAKT